MIKSLTFSLVFVLALCSPAHSMERAFGSCEQGGYNVQVGGLPATTTEWMRSFEECTVTVYLSGITQVGIASISRTSNVVTAILTATYPSYGLNASVTVTGVANSSFNGTFQVSAAPGTTSLSWAQAGANASSSGGQAAFLPRIFADNISGTPTVLSNPFVAATDAYWRFYAVGGRYDARFSLADIPTPYARADYLLCDPIGPNADAECGAGAPGGPHNLLSATHIDTLPASVVAGDVVRGNGTPLWERLPAGTEDYVLTMDAGLPEWRPNCTSVQYIGSEVDCEHEINFIPGSNIDIVVTPGTGATDVTITASGSLSVLCDPTKNVTFYVDPAGSDTTGDGSFANPWKTVQKAWNDGVPDLVDGKYTIQLKSAGTYVGTTVLANKLFFGYSFDYTNCEVPSTPCSIVTINGSTTTATSFILSATAADTVVSGVNEILVDGVPVTIRGVRIQKAGIGLLAQNGAKVTLGAVNFINNYTGLIVTGDAQIFIEPTSYVNDCAAPYDNWCGSVNFENGTIGGVPFAANYAVATVGGYITDVCSTSKSDPGTGIVTYSNGGGFIRSLFNVGGEIFFRGDFNFDGSQLFSEGNRDLQVQTIIMSGVSGTSIALSGSRLSASAWLGGSYSISGGTVGVSLDGMGSWVDTPSPNTATTPIRGPQFLGNLINSAMGQQLAFSTMPQTVTGSTSTTALDVSKGQIIKVTVTAATTEIGMVNTVNPGEFLYLQVCQDGVGSHTVTFSAEFIGEGTVTTTASKCNSQTFRWSVPDSAFVAAGAMTPEF